MVLYMTNSMATTLHLEENDKASKKNYYKKTFPRKLIPYVKPNMLVLVYDGKMKS